MISSTFGGYMIARLGLQASQDGLYITGQNLTNSGTEGYTRQRLDQISINYGGTYRYASKYNVNIGNGVLVTGTSQLRDPFLDLRYRNEVAHASEQSAKLDVLNDLKDILDEVKNNKDDSLNDGGIFNQLGKIYETFQQLSNQVGNKEFETMIKSSCQSLVTLFQNYSKRIDEVKTNLEYDIQNVDVPQVNKILANIQNLNKTIKNSEIVGNSALELKDERNRQIDALSEYMKIKVTYKPIAVSDTRVVDECHIALVGSDGNNYELINDGQRREVELSQDGDKWNIGLGKLSPVDADLRSAYESALRTVDRAQQAYDNSVGNFEKARDTLDGINDIYDDLVKAATEAREKATGPVGGDGKGGLYADWQDAVKAYNDAFAAKDPATPADELKKLLEARNTARDEYNAAENEARKAEFALSKYQSTYDEAKQAYDEALDLLDKGPGLKGTDGKPLKDIDGNDASGNGKAAENLAAAEKARDAALAELEQAEYNGRPIESVNTILMDGKLKGNLDMLNYSAEFDNPPNSIRGIGYYKNMLDSLANTFATEMNKANNLGIKVGEPVDPNDPDSDIITAHDLFKSNDGGKITAGNIDIADGWLDNSYGITVSHKDDPVSGSNDNVSHFVSLFETKVQYKADMNLMNDIKISDADPKGTPNKSQIDGMKNGDTVTIDGKTYTFTKGATGEAGNEFSDLASLQKAAEKNGVKITETGGLLSAETVAKDLTGLVSVNGKAVSPADINVDSMSYGDEITIDGVTFTYRQNAGSTDDTADFNNMASLVDAAAAKGISITPSTSTNAAITGAPVDLTALKDGEKIDIGGKEFVYKKPATGEEGTFSDQASLIQEANKQGLSLKFDSTGKLDSASSVSGKITAIDKTAGEERDLDIQTSPSINAMGVGDTITIDGKTFTKCQAPADGTSYSDAKLAELAEQGKFYDMDTLKAAAEKQGIEIYGDPDTGEITSATKVGANLFNGTFVESFVNIGNMLSNDLASTSQKLDNYSQLAGSIADEREAVTGVSLDEEAMNIRRYQQAYTASARLMTALDEMLNVLLTQTGLVGR